MQSYPPHIDSFPANMTRRPNVGLMLGQRRSTTLDQRIVFAGLTHIVAAILNRSDKISVKSITNVYSPGVTMLIFTRKFKIATLIFYKRRALRLTQSFHRFYVLLDVADVTGYIRLVTLCGI